MSGSVGSASDFIRGITFKPDELIAVEADDAVVCMRTKNVQKDLDDSDLIAVPSRLVRNKEKLLRHGDILISSANSWELVGKCSYVGELAYPATAGGFIAIVRPKKHTHPRYLYHWLTSPRMQHEIRHCGRQTTNISNLDVGRFKALPFPEFDFNEQRRIAAILDKADAIRRKRQQALVFADEFLKSAYVHLVGHRNPAYGGWQPETIEKLAEDKKGAIRSGPFGSALLHSEFVDEGVAVLGIDNAVQNQFAWGQRRFITKEKYEELRRYRVFPGDVIITIMGTTGRSAVVPDNIPEAITTKHLASITCDTSKILPEVLSFAIHSDPMIIRQIKQHNKGAIMDGLNLGIIKQLVLPTPPMRLQQRFAEVLRNVSKQKEQISNALGDGTELFASLAQRAFRGEL
ncbi:restriction endonuclease subunit S [uncultured Agrobacterium sp.]|uniref:restriction endonuclease subunit S n=1 Tax=uncultured Agrobacterium sp. TaxID=157277 RepID=UPI0025F567CF|nr:restriction endonuclease subunit S [uncultured Agrobacterium sp.]